MKLKIEIGLTPELEAIARAFLSARTEVAAAPVALTAGTPPRKEKPEEAQKKPAKATETDKRVNRTEEEAKEPEKPKKEPKTEPKEEPKAEAKEEPKPEAKAEDGPRAYTEEDIREAMHNCRLRIEGPDYRTNPEGEGYLKHHRGLTAQFKLMAQTLGHDRPSALPAELRKSFIDDCACLVYDEEKKQYLPATVLIDNQK